MSSTSTRVVRALALLALTAPAWAIQDAAQTPPPAKPAQTPPPTAAAGDAAKPKTAFSNEQLEQIVAPIALYPDTLLAQMMMGATYPLEIVEAARWQQKNASLKGKARDEALKAFDWDPSVKSLCTFPDVLTKMNDNLDWTQDLGDAFLGQKTELFGAIQKMRGKAMEAGQLKTTDQQKVTQEADKIIVIESADPEVIYVPTYSPTVVYAGWAYPTYYYPPMYAYPPGAGFVTFGLGVAFGAAVWGNCDWNDCDVDIDIDHHNEFNRNVDRDSTRNKIENRAGDQAGNRANNQAGNRAGTQPSNRAGNKAGNTTKFNHNPEHRKGVNYQNPSTAQKYGGGSGSNRVTKDQARGFDRGAAPSTGRTGSTGPRATPPATASSGARAPASTGAAGGRPTSGSTGNAPRPSTKSTASGSSSASSSRGSALSGSRSPSLDRASSTRGASSRSSGASRGGGGGRGGGRGGGGRR